MLGTTCRRRIICHGVGNEDRITFLFKKRFELIYDAVKSKHPGITVIGTVGPFADGDDYDQGWQIAVSSVRDSASGDLILKIVNGDDAAKTLQIELHGAKRLPRQATATVLTGEADRVNDYSAKRLLKPQTSVIPVAGSFSYAATSQLADSPAHRRQEPLIAAPRRERTSIATGL